MATHMVAAAQRTFRELHGVVVSAGLMQKTVKVRVGSQQWNEKVKKHFSKPKSYLVHDPRESLRTGDVVAISPGWRTSKSKRHVVQRIISPAQISIEKRPAIPTQQERWAVAITKHLTKVARRDITREGRETSRAAEVQQLREMRRQKKFEVFQWIERQAQNRLQKDGTQK